MIRSKIALPMLGIAVSLLTACSEPPSPPESTMEQTIPMTYPETEKGNVVDDYFGTTVPDPYRWLEDDRSKETEDWVTQQNQVTFGYLEQIPYREALKDQLSDMWNYERESAPFKEGDYIYFYRNDGLQNQSVLYRKKEGGAEEIFLDPNSFSEDGTTSLATIRFSDNGKIAAYAISEGGSDWRKIRIIDTESRALLEPELLDIKFSGIEWQANEGFYYSSYDKPDGSELSAKTDQHKLYFHKLGTSQDEDQLVFGRDESEKYRYVGASVTNDYKYLIVNAAQTTSGDALWLKDLSKPNSELVVIQPDESADTFLIANKGETLILKTNRDAPNGKIVSVKASDPGVANWVDLIPETENVLSASQGAGYLFAEYMIDAISRVYQYNYEGKLIREIALPGVGSSSTISGKEDDSPLYYQFTNYVTPSTIYALDPESGESTVYRRSQAKFKSEDFVSQQVFYTSKDGTRVPMIISHHKSVTPNSKNPTLLYGYGGFNISLTPNFSMALAVWMQQGGIYAVPNIRGGGEYGKDWHIAGTKLQKQNVFDDFIAAAEYLIKEKYTSSDYLALYGGSNGGLLVGAVMNQRPDLMKVALPAVGVMDMLRYHTFTAGAGWAYDYGTSEDNPEMFEYLKAYSPVHNVQAGKKYPATMVTTADHDDRVVPAHSFKFAATLQAADTGPAPTLIRIETNAGHGAGKPVSKTIEQYADLWSFALYNMGVKQLPKLEVKEN